MKYEISIPSKTLTVNGAVKYLRSLNDDRLLIKLYAYDVGELGYRGAKLNNISEAIETIMQYCDMVARNKKDATHHYNNYHITDNALIMTTSTWIGDSYFPNYKHELPFPLPETIFPPDRPFPFVYNTQFNINELNVGDLVELTFKNEQFKVEKQFRGKTIQFIVHAERPDEYGVRFRRKTLIKADRLNNYKKEDILFLDAYCRFKGLMIDLFPCNRIPYRGWKNKEVTLKVIKKATP